MFYSFQDHETEYKWKRRGDPNDACVQRVYHQANVVHNIIRKACEEGWSEDPKDACVQRVYHQANIVNNIIRRTCMEGWSEHQDPYAHYMDHTPRNMEKSISSMDRIKHQLNLVNNTISKACGERQLDAYNFGLANNSCFSKYNSCSISQDESRSNFMAKTSNSQLLSEMSNDELMYKDFIENQRKQNEELLEKLNSLSSKFKVIATQHEKIFETKIVQELCSSYRSQDEQNDTMTLQSNEKLESYSSLKEIAIYYETDSDDDTQFEINEKQEKIEEPKVVAPPPNILPIFIPLRLTYIDKSNELELKDPPIASIIYEIEKNEDGGNPLEVEASDMTNEKITNVDLSSQLEKCLKNHDVMEGDKPQIKYHIKIERRKMTSKLENVKHISRVFLKYLWVNYDALNGRKVKIR